MLETQILSRACILLKNDQNDSYLCVTYLSSLSSQFNSSNLPQIREKKNMTYSWITWTWLIDVPIIWEIIFVWSVRPLLSANGDSDGDFLMYCTVWLYQEWLVTFRVCNIWQLRLGSWYPMIVMIFFIWAEIFLYLRYSPFFTWIYIRF